MTTRTDLAADRVVALTLKIGAYLAFALIVLGMLLLPVLPEGRKIASAGLLVLLATPVVRIVVAGAQFVHERDWKYAVISFVVLGIMVVAYALGIKV
jgi:uncharacterized membrane protein